MLRWPLADLHILHDVVERPLAQRNLSDACAGQLELILVLDLVRGLV